MRRERQSVCSHQHNRTRQGPGAPEIESGKWVNGLKRVNDAAGAIGKPILLVQDREADFFEFFAAPRAKDVSILARIFQRRTLEPDQDGELHRYRLDEAFDQLQDNGGMSVGIFRDGAPVTLRLWVRPAMVHVLPHRDKGAKTPKPEHLRLVAATGIAATDSKGKDLFEAQEAAEWILLTSLDQSSGVIAMEIVGFYALRWRIERLHYVQKSGRPGSEKLQFDEVKTFFNALALYSIVACRILQLTYALRQDDLQESTIYLRPVELQVIAAATVRNRYGAKACQLPPPNPELLGDAVRALVRQEGFAPSKRQPYPGAKVLGSALVRLNRLVEGYNLAMYFSLQD